MGSNKTADELLDTAQHLVQERGFNAFSYKDLAEQVGIRAASIHYHFPAKTDLGVAMMARCSQQLRRALAELDASEKSPRTKLMDFIGFYRKTEEVGAICVFGSMATDLKTLPKSVRDEVSSYIQISEAWIVEAIEAGVRSGHFEPAGTPQGAAACLLAGLQGALILARAMDRAPEILDNVEASFFRSLNRA